MAIIGAQHSSKPAASALTKPIAFLREDCPEKHWPAYWEPASVTDNTGAFNEILIAYWQSESLYHQWEVESGFHEWWQGLTPESEQHGWFLEVFLPSIDRLETVFSSREPGVNEGVAYMRTGLSGPIKEHVYWGSMRDRLPAAQTDTLAGTREAAVSNHVNGKATSVEQRRRVHGKKNLAVIRSGQDWSNTIPQVISRDDAPGTH